MKISQCKFYVVGFVFTEDYSKVILIKKTHPKWQAGKLNGVGGQTEEMEAPSDAMTREFYQEAGVQVKPEAWIRFCYLYFPDQCGVDCFCLANDKVFNLVISKTEEKIVRVEVSRLRGQDCVPDIHWLIPMAVNHITGNCGPYNVKAE